MARFWRFGGHPPHPAKALQFQHRPKFRGAFPRGPLVGVGQEGVADHACEDPTVGADEPLAFMLHHATGLHRRVGGAEFPGVGDFPFGQVDHDHADACGQEGLAVVDHDVSNALGADHLGDAQVREVGHTPRVFEVDPAVVVANHPQVRDGVVGHGGGLALGQPLALHQTLHFVTRRVNGEEREVGASHHLAPGHHDLFGFTIREVVTPARHFILRAQGGAGQGQKPNKGSKSVHLGPHTWRSSGYCVQPQRSTGVLPTEGVCALALQQGQRFF